MLVDSHCHLNYPEFADLPAVLARAAGAGVHAMQTISTKRSEFEAILAIADAHAPVYASIGIHPHEAEHHADLSAEELIQWATRPKVIGIGETGLDYYYEHSPRDIQRQLFRTHIVAAQETKLPLIVHSRDADLETIEILREEFNRSGKQSAFTGLIHCFSTTEELSDKAMEIGFYISIAGILTFKKSQALRDIVKKIPLDRLLVETDAPYLAPEPFRGRPNEPAYTRYVAEKVAEIKGISLDEVSRVTTDNFYRLFSKAKRPEGV